MLTESEIKMKGFEARYEALGDLDVEKFISLLIRDPFDYTKWSIDLWHDKTLTQISKVAMDYQKHLEKKQ